MNWLERFSAYNQTMPVFITILAAKTSYTLSRMFGRGDGSALPGLVAEKLDPGALRKLGQNLSEGSIVITGTNGKTTTTKMLLDILRAAGRRVVTNRSGSNLSRGILASLIEQSSISGKVAGNLGLFEVDEASMPAVCARLQPKIVVILNLFRDQLDRYGELDSTAKLLGDTISMLGAEIYLNADDPLVSSLADYVEDRDKVHFFGVQAADTRKLAYDLAADSTHCPHDGRALVYRRTFFGHIGHYRCPGGDFKRPVPQTAIADYREGHAVVIDDAVIKLPLPGLYNAYNALAAFAVAQGLEINPKVSVQALESTEAAFGRVERLEMNGRHVYILLVKNPTGFNQVIQTFLIGRPGALMLAINDNFADGRDVSWLWDVAIEELRGAEHHIIASGIRASDMALRLKYAGLESDVESDLEAGLEKTLAGVAEGETVYVLPTYTAMLELRQIMAASSDIKGGVQ
jgi:UDP-N-acetylmuramyl tripeptide synthase